MDRKFWWLRPVLVAPLGLCVLLTVLSAFVNIYLFYLEALLCILMSLYVVFKLHDFQQDMYEFLTYLSDSVTVGQRENIELIPFPLIATNAGGEVIWYNALCKDQVFLGEDQFGVPVSNIIAGADPAHIGQTNGANIRYKDKMYTVFATRVQTEQDPIHVYYLVDDTALKKYMTEYRESRPSTMLVMIDNYQEMVQNVRESEKAAAVAQIDGIIEKYMGQGNCLLRRLDRDQFLVVSEERYLRTMIERRFDILDQVRKITLGDVPFTLSIGVGQGAANLQESEKMARQALEMVLGRGGDQVAIKNGSNYSFYGGTSKGVEKRTKVRTRIMASAIAELINTAENVLIMGHQFGDLDSLGAAVGLYKAARTMGKQTKIVLNRKTTLAGPLYRRLAESGYTDAFVDPADAENFVEKKTLLFIVDTHLPHILESREVYEAAKTVVVIDHHRKMVGHIEDAVIFYHEPYASSASEMVTELIQYFGDGMKLEQIEAEALLSGIMLDTKNFVLKTGVRTFEAAAYLRKQGAEPVEVRKLFANSMVDYQMKNRLVSSAQIYRGCAVVAGEYFEDIKLVAPQAADELLGIHDVAASFVFYEYGGGVSYSARSYGQMNVQVIMESLGGGGHMTIAGAQVPDITLDEGEKRLYAAIDLYFEQTKKIPSDS